MTERREPMPTTAPTTATAPQSGAPFTYGGPGGPDGPRSYPVAPRNGLGTAALVLGILAVVTCWTVVGGFVLGLLALIFGLVGRGRANRGQATNGGVAVAGAVLGALALIATIVIVAVGATFFAHHQQDFKNLNDCMINAQTQQQRQACQNQFNNAVTGG